MVITVSCAVAAANAWYLRPEAFPDGAPEGFQLFSDTKVVFQWKLSRGEVAEQSTEATIRISNASAQGIPLPKEFGGRLVTASADAMHRAASDAAVSAKERMAAFGAIASCECPRCQDLLAPLWS